ncbi:MAG: hypothetical protein WBM50_19685 [Acidimicrobiales bacterium]
MARGIGRQRGRVVVSCLLVPLLVGTGCSGSLDFGNGANNEFTDAAEALIEGDLADQIGLGPLDATCDGDDPAAGDTFECSATPDGQATIRFTATINAEGDTVGVASTNLLLADQVQQVEAFAAALIEEQTGTLIGAENFQCGETSIVVSDGEIIDCTVTDPADGTVYDAPVTVDDLAQLAITVSLGDPIS